MLAGGAYGAGTASWSRFRFANRHETIKRHQ